MRATLGGKNLGISIVTLNTVSSGGMHFQLFVIHSVALKLIVLPCSYSLDISLYGWMMCDEIVITVLPLQKPLKAMAIGHKFSHLINDGFPFMVHHEQDFGGK